eukprot:6220040-Pyramimonas_sp.AAC.1
MISARHGHILSPSVMGVSPGRASQGHLATDDRDLELQSDGDSALFTEVKDAVRKHMSSASCFNQADAAMEVRPTLNIHTAAPYIHTIAPYIRTIAPNIRTVAANIHTIAPYIRIIAPNIHTIAPNIHIVAPNIYWVGIASARRPLSPC